MSDSDISEMSVESTGGYLLIAIKIPTDVCGVCNSVIGPVVDSQYVKQLIKSFQPIQCAFLSPSSSGWIRIASGSGGNGRLDGKTIWACPKCCKELVLARASAEAIEKDVSAAILAKIKRP